MLLVRRCVMAGLLTATGSGCGASMSAEIPTVERELTPAEEVAVVEQTKSLGEDAGRCVGDWEDDLRQKRYRNCLANDAGAGVGGGCLHLTSTVDTTDDYNALVACGLKAGPFIRPVTLGDAQQSLRDAIGFRYLTIVHADADGLYPVAVLYRGLRSDELSSLVDRLLQERFVVRSIDHALDNFVRRWHIENEDFVEETFIYFRDEPGKAVGNVVLTFRYVRVRKEISLVVQSW
jgi:hypothetical protein